MKGVGKYISFPFVPNCHPQNRVKYDPSFYIFKKILKRVWIETDRLPIFEILYPVITIHVPSPPQMYLQPTANQQGGGVGGAQGSPVVGSVAPPLHYCPPPPPVTLPPTTMQQVRGTNPITSDTSVRARERELRVVRSK